MLISYICVCKTLYTNYMLLMANNIILNICIPELRGTYSKCCHFRSDLICA